MNIEATKTIEFHAAEMTNLWIPESVVPSCTNTVSILLEAVLFTAVHIGESHSASTIKLYVNAKHIARLGGCKQGTPNNPREFKQICKAHNVTYTWGGKGTVVTIDLDRWRESDAYIGRTAIDPVSDIRLNLASFTKLSGKAGLLYNFIRHAGSHRTGDGWVKRTSYLLSKLAPVVTVNNIQRLVKQLVDGGYIKTKRWSSPSGCVTNVMCYKAVKPHKQEEATASPADVKVEVQGDGQEVVQCETCAAADVDDMFA